jgi:hypothetical protein
MISALVSCLTIIGTWQYVGFQYEDRYYPNPNPNLILQFTFNDNLTSRLHWHRTNETGFCERLASYRVEGDFLYQKTTWVNPDNARECYNDPDMQMGKETTTLLQCQDQQLGFVMELSGKPFIYLLENVTQ